MIEAFKDKGSKDIFNGKETREARKKCPRSLWRIASRKMDQLDSIKYMDELRIPPGNRFESLSGDRKGEYSIRINDKYRICFRFVDDNPDQVEITDYH